MEDGLTTVTINEGLTTSQTVTNISKTTWIEHSLLFMKLCWVSFLVTFFTILSSLWFFKEIYEYIFDKIPTNNIITAVSLILFSFSISFILSLLKYNNNIPQHFENESIKAQTIMRKKDILWQYSLAHELIESRISIIDKKLGDVKCNRIFVKTDRTMDIIEYSDWVQHRLTNILSLIEVTKQLLVVDVIDAISNVKEDGSDIRDLIEKIDLVLNLYEDLYDYDIESRRLSVPDSCVHLHSLQLNWSDVIRDATHQFLSILSKISNNKDDFSPVHAEIVFIEIPKLDEFIEELEHQSTLL